MSATFAESSREVRRSRLLTLGGSYSLEVGGCGRNNRSFRVFSPRPIDTARVQPGQVELFAEGSGSVETVPGKGRRCSHESPGGIVVDVAAWVLDPPQTAAR